MTDFRFFDYEPFTDGEIDVVLREKRPAPKNEDHVPSYYFDIRLPGKSEVIGQIDIRIGNTEYLEKYAGHIGYGIKAQYRGNRYAAKACNLIKTVAIDHGMTTLWITCNPDNYPSRRICEILGCELVETVNLPKDTDIYKRGEKQKCRYRWDLDER